MLAARLAAAALLLLPAAGVAAGQIQLQLTTRAQFRDGVLQAELAIRNGGDEAARLVRASLALGEDETHGSARESLAAGDSYSEALALPVTGRGVGRWPFRISVDYSDTNQHPFQVLQVATLVLGTPPPVGLELEGVEVTPVADTGIARIRVRNTGTSPRRTTLGLLVPKDIEAERPRSVEIGAGARVELGFELAARSARPGSRYAVFAVAEHEDAGIHQALVHEAAVQIEERRARLAPGLLAAAVALLAVWAVLLRRRRAAGQR